VLLIYEAPGVYTLLIFFGEDKNCQTYQRKMFCDSAFLEALGAVTSEASTPTQTTQSNHFGFGFDQNPSIQQLAQHLQQAQQAQQQPQVNTKRVYLFIHVSFFIPTFCFYTNFYFKICCKKLV